MSITIILSIPFQPFSLEYNMSESNHYWEVECHRKERVVYHGKVQSRNDLNDYDNGMTGREYNWKAKWKKNIKKTWMAHDIMKYNWNFQNIEWETIYNKNIKYH